MELSLECGYNQHCFCLDRTQRYEWTRNYYLTSTTSTTTTTARPNYQPNVFQGNYYPGSYQWFNRTRWTESSSRGYDPDLDGTTLPPEEFEEEEPWDGRDFHRPNEDSTHPLGRIGFYSVLGKTIEH